MGTASKFHNTMKKSKLQLKSGGASTSNRLQGNLPRKGESKTRGVPEPPPVPTSASRVGDCTSANTSGAASLIPPGGEQRVMLPGGHPPFKALTSSNTKCTIRLLKEGKAGNGTIILDAYIHKSLTDNSFLIGDKEDSIALELEPYLVKFVQIGKFYRLVKPTLVDNKVHIGNIKPLPIKPFNYAPFQDGLDEKHKTQPKELKTFVDIAAIPPASVVPQVVAKIVYLSKEKQSKFSRFRTAAIKDVDNNKNFISLYGAFAEEVTDGHVYVFKNITVQNYKGFKDEYFRLSTKSNSIIKEVGEEVNILFSNITPGDGCFTGIIIGHEEPYVYLSCPFCKKANYETGDNFCNFCKKSTIGKSPTIDFNVVLIVQEKETDKIFHSFCFRSHLGIKVESHDKDIIQEMLEKEHFKECRIDYLKDTEKDDEHVRVLQITFS